MLPLDLTAVLSRKPAIAIAAVTRGAEVRAPKSQMTGRGRSRRLVYVFTVQTDIDSDRTNRAPAPSGQGQTQLEGSNCGSVRQKSKEIIDTSGVKSVG